ncbi:flagellin [Gymnodinialimonas hymeniacidonis]|uniref:flagellin n=1 Tax=Gymnodinialimonas hymeniacidonis TaxID=3126508 RepID=UPI0034C688B1
MSITTFGDMAQFQSLRKQGSDLRSDIARLTAELASGKVTDTGRNLNGDFSALTDVTRGLRLNEAFKTSISNAEITTDGRQTALDRVASELVGFGASLLSLAGTSKTESRELDLLNTPERFGAAVAALNTQFAGQSLFAADAPENIPLIPAEDILAELRNVTAGLTDAASLETAVLAWFNDPGGAYQTFAWQGGDGEPPETLLSEGQTAATGVSALDPAIRETLAGLAMATLAADKYLSLSSEERADLLSRSGQQVLSGETDLVDLRARLGAEQARIEEARVAAETTRSALELEYGRLVEADPYRTATELEAASLQLESLYILTARMSRLSLTEFLR